MRSGGGVSDCPSKREIDSIRRMVLERKKEARKDNIIIRGWEVDGRREITRESVEEFIKDKLGVGTKVWWCRRSENVVVVKLESEAKKRAVMENKNKLKGGIIFIKNDLT